MKNRTLPFVLALVLGSATLGSAADSSLLAATPPMGWNSWDGYGTTVKEADVKANAQWLAEHLKPFGWQYVVVDMEWYVTNPDSRGKFQDIHLQPGQVRPLHSGGKPVSVRGE